MLTIGCLVGLATRNVMNPLARFTFLTLKFRKPSKKIQERRGISVGRISKKTLPRIGVLQISRQM